MKKNTQKKEEKRKLIQIQTKKYKQVKACLPNLANHQLVPLNKSYDKKTNKENINKQMKTKYINKHN